MYTTIEQLVADLPEKYQPIFGHPEISDEASRASEDRLQHIHNVYDALSKLLDRPLRVLDLGCAQGYFSLSLAKLGASVHGVDYLDKNIAVCQALASENSAFITSFEIGRIEHVLANLEHDQYDLVLGLSVFHHLIYEHGLQDVQSMLTALAEKVEIAIFEVALTSEPLYWAPSQALQPRKLLDGFAFVHLLAEHETHLSDIKRPLYIASNQYWYLNGVLHRFDSWKIESHHFANGTHHNTRRYYFGGQYIAKLYNLDHAQLFKPNQDEYSNEVNFLTNPPDGYHAPRLLLNNQNKDENWLVRDLLPGKLLLDKLSSGEPYDAEKIIFDVLTQLAILEKAGMYHNDVRVWNVLVNEDGHANLIDYGAITNSPKDCVWPFNLFLSCQMFIYEVLTRKVIAPSHVREFSFNPDKLLEPYRSVFLALFQLPQEQWSFSKLLESLNQNLVLKTLDANNGIQVISEAMMSGFGLFNNAIDAKVQLAHEAEFKLQQAESRITTLEAESRAVLAEAQLSIIQFELRAKLAESRINVVEAELRAGSAEARIISLEAESRAALAEAKSTSLESALSEVRAELHNTHQANHHHWLIAEDRQRHIQALLNSTSWRITAPLRWVRQTVGGLSQKPDGITKVLKSKLKTFLIHSRLYVLRRPKLMRLVNLILAHFPHLKGRINRVTMNVMQEKVYQQPAVTEFELLTPRARKVYKDLKDAIEEHQKGVN